MTVSEVLKNANVDVSAGELIDDEQVSKVLVQQLPKPPFIVDGFPRTRNQVHLMSKEWPKEIRVDAIVSLEVEREVCRQKLLGRRICPICNQNWNVADVNRGRYVLPPHLPKSCNQCSGTEDEWVKRPDDTTAIIDSRLDQFYESTAPILQFYKDQDSVFQFTPYLGFDDLPRFQTALEAWLRSR